MKTQRSLAVAALLSAFTALAQNPQPNVTNAKFESVPYSGDLNTQLRAIEATWFGYAVESVHRDHEGCCWDGSAGCWLEQPARRVESRESHQPIRLEGSNEIAILFRVENNTIGKIRVYSLLCPLDAGGLHFVWITGVPSGASLSFLEKFATAGADHLADAAIFAISQHDGSEAIDFLIHAAKFNASAHTRGQALFWLAQRAGERASATIVNAIENDPNTEVKKKAVFALSQLPKDEGIPKLIEIARTQRNPEVRKQAFFWLGQSHDPRALAFIEEVLTK